MPPRSAAATAPVPVTGYCWPLPVQETLWHSKAGLAQSFVEFTAPFSGSWCTQVLFTPSKQLCHVWDSILNAIAPILPSFWGFSFDFGQGYLFLVGYNLSIVVQQLVMILVFLQEKMSTCPSTLPSWVKMILHNGSQFHYQTAPWCSYLACLSSHS